jgi:hypothetical protein
MKFSLLYLAEPKFGGWVSFTEHLYRCLKSQGHTVNLYTVGARLAPTLLPYSGSVMTQRIPAQAVSELSGALIVTALDSKNLEAANVLRSRKAAYVVHDPTELDDERTAVFRKANHIFAIRKTMGAVLSGKGLASSFIPHPYAPSNPTRNPSRNAVAFSRLDWDKHTDLIAEANTIVPANRRCCIYGAENTIYTFHKINTRFPNWRNNYYGKFERTEGAGARLAASANWVVDMSAIKDDGCGTQYTFLEAWDGGAALIVNTKWTKDNKGELRDGFNCLAARDGAHLAALLERQPSAEIIENGRRTLVEHLPASVSDKVCAAFL